MNIRKRFFSGKEENEKEVSDLSADNRRDDFFEKERLHEPEVLEEPVDKKKSATYVRFLLKFNQLYLLENRFMNRDSVPDDYNLDYTDFTIDGEPASPEEQFHMEAALQMGKDRLQKALQNEAAASAADEEAAKALKAAALKGLEKGSPEEEIALGQVEAAIASMPKKQPEPIDWDMGLFVAKDGLTAWIYLFPPLFGGADPTTQEVLARLESEGVLFGLENDLVEVSIKTQKYFKIIPVAHGIPPINGENGRIIDHFSREYVNKLAEQEDAMVVDYKDLGLFQKVSQGQLICDVILPTEGTPGVTIKGDPIKPTPGKSASVPKGSNTVLTEDGLRLLAGIDGQLEFSNGMFLITQVTTIRGDVDNSTGNIDVNGDVLIHGDVLGGFSVKATGSIQVNGAVEDAVLVAGANIVIKQGMNGNGIGSLSAQENVHCKFLENTTVFAGKKVSASSLINCNISCNGQIVVREGKGIIVGGTLIAGKSIEATTIGNMAHGRTIFTIGATVEFLQEKSTLEEEIRSIRQIVEDTEKNLRYLEKIPGPKEGQLEELYETLKSQLKSQSSKLRFKELRLAQMDKMQHDYSKCFIKCDKLHPVSYISIGGFQRVVENEYSHCYFCLRDTRIELTDFIRDPDALNG